MKHILYAIAILSILSGCNSADKNALPIPKDASFVLHINTRSLASKLTREELRQSAWFSRLQLSTTDTLAMQIIQNPESSGIEIEGDLVFFARKTGRNEGYAGFTGRVKDAATFESFNKKLSRQSAAVVKDGDINTISLDERAMAGWTGNKFLYIFDTRGRNNRNRNIEDTTSTEEDQYDVAPLTPADLKGYTVNLFSLDGDSMLVDDERYRSLIDEEGDMHLWMNAQSAYGTGLPMGMLSMLRADTYLRETVTATTLNFEKGKIVLNAKVYSNDQMTSLFKKYEGEKLNENFLERLPSDSVSAVLVMNYKPEGLRELLRVGGLDGMVNATLADLGITMDDFIKANKGDLMFAVSDFSFTPPVTTTHGDSVSISSKAQAKAFLAVSIADKAAFDKLIALGKRFGEAKRMDTSTFHNMTNELFAIGNNKEAVDKFIQGGNRKMHFASRITGHPIGVYIDLQKFMRAFATRPGDSLRTQAHALSVAMWQDVVMTGGEFKDGALVQNIEVNLVDKNTNSLKQLNQYADRMSLLEKRGF